MALICIVDILDTCSMLLLTSAVFARGYFYPVTCTTYMYLMELNPHIYIYIYLHIVSK